MPAGPPLLFDIRTIVVSQGRTADCPQVVRLRPGKSPEVELGQFFTDNPMPDLCVHAVIPAAGQSTRMGRPKLALPLGGRSVLERVVDALRGAGVDVLVVLGPHVADLAAAAQT